MRPSMISFLAIIAFQLVLLSLPATCFQSVNFWKTNTRQRQVNSQSQPPLFSGYGIAEDYSWKEDALEIEVTVQVPAGTKAKDVLFKPGITSIDLQIQQEDSEEQPPLVLLDGNRKLRGRISLDGVYWVFSDRRRSITVTLEKYFPHSADDMQVLDYDWKGLYPDDDEEVSDRKYDEPEVLNVREYAASLGVDVDNINRSMVDETMFSSGLNLTQRTLDQLTEKGYLEEVTKQADGTEYRTNPETGEPEPITALENNGKETATTNSKQIKIPFLDTESPWSQAVPVSVDPKTNKTSIADRDVFRESLKKTAKGTTNKKATPNDKPDEEDDPDPAAAVDPNQMVDPIDMLTVKRLKEILKEQGLIVSGSKKELQDRLRNQVNSFLNDPTKKDKNKQS